MTTAAMMLVRISNIFRFLLWCSTLLLIGTTFGGPHDTNAKVFKTDQSPTNNIYLRILHVEKSYILVGSKSNLYNVSTETMTVNSEQRWSPFSEEILYCQGEIEKFARDCNSYIRSVIKRSDSLFHVCASSSKKPQCREYRVVDGKWNLTNTKVNNELVQSLSPLLPWNEMIVMTTKDTNTVYVASHILKSASIWQPSFFRGNSINTATNAIVPGLKTDFNDQLFKIDYYSERATEFTSIFETEDYVYLTYSEPAIETLSSLSSEPTAYSRIARVCKNDRGRGKDDENPLSEYLFATLFKTRLMCGDAGVMLQKPSSGYISQQFSGYYGVYINEIADTSAPHLSSVTGADGEKIIMAVFNSPKASAICAYRISDIDRIFDTSDQIKFGTDQVPQVKSITPPAATCYEDSRNQTSESRSNMNNYLLANHIYPINNHSLFLASTDYRMTQMVVEWQVESHDGKKYDVIFISTDDGRLLKLVKFKKANEMAEKYHIVEERIIFPGKAIVEMKLIVDVDDKKHLLVNTLEEIKRVALEKCHFHSTCTDCVALQDPYCSWSPSIAKCVSTTHEVQDKYQNISSGHSPVCVEDNITEEPTVIELTTKLPEENTLIAKSGQVLTGGQSDINPTNNSVLIALVVILPILVAVLSFAAGYMFSKKKFSSSTQHLDQELTNKFKEDSLNCDAYQILPKQSNLQLTNNLNGKLPNGDAGDRNMNKQKQVYV